MYASACRILPNRPRATASRMARTARRARHWSTTPTLTPATPGCRVHLVQLAQRHGGRLFHEHVLPARDRLQERFAVQVVGGEDADGADRRVVEHRFQRGVTPAAKIRAKARQPRRVQVARRLQPRLPGCLERAGVKRRDQAGAEQTKTQGDRAHGFTSLRDQQHLQGTLGLDLVEGPPPAGQRQAMRDDFARRYLPGGDQVNGAVPARVAR